MNIINMTNIVKSYNGNTVVNLKQLNVNEGEVYGLIGPNGAGKSTIMKMLCSLVQPTSGQISVLGKDLNESNRIPILKEMGAFIEGPSYYENLSGLDNMRIVRDLKGLDTQQMNVAIEIVGLKNHIEKRVKEYSLGMKQRLGIAMTIIGFPKLIILDEPTNGLDPQGMEEVRQLISVLAREHGTSIMISSHILDEVEKIADHIGIINRGEFVYEGSITQFKAAHGSKISFRTSDDENAAMLLENFNPKLEDNRLSLPNLSDVEIGRAIKILIESNIYVYRVFEDTKSLEQLFIELTGKGSL